MKISHYWTYRYLRSKALDVPLPGLASQLPDSAPSEGLFVVDTSELFSALTGSDADTPQTLQRICKHLLIDMGELHNAGTNAQVGISSFIRARLIVSLAHPGRAALHGLGGTTGRPARSALARTD
jgi:hypothetical protein